jgi:hypothetical protein
MSQEDGIRPKGLPQSRFELELLRAVLDDVDRDIKLWLQAKPSTQEQVCLHSMQPRLGEIYRILTHQIEGHASLDEDKERIRIGHEVVSLFHRAKGVRGNAVGKNWDRLTERLQSTEAQAKSMQQDLESKAAGRPAKQDKAVTAAKSRFGRMWYDTDSDTLRRRQIVLKNPKMPSRNLCKVFDNWTPPIPLPRDWQGELGVATWSKAYENKTVRNRIQKIISTDRRAKQ